jgi:HEAT repeat protein
MTRRDETSQQGDDRIHVLLDAMRNNNHRLKESTIESIVQDHDESSAAAVASLLEDPDPEVRMAAVDVLTRIGTHVPATSRSLTKHPDPLIRAWGCQFLGSGQDALECLLEAARDHDANVRGAACTALGAFPDERATDALIARLGDVEWVAFTAIQALGRAANERAVSPLIAMLGGGEGLLPLAACEGLLALKDEAITGRVVETIGGLEGFRREGFIRIMLETNDDAVVVRLRASLGTELLSYLLKQAAQEPGSLRLLRALALFPCTEACGLILDALTRCEDEDPEGDELFRLFLSLTAVWRHDIVGYMRRDPAYVGPVVKACAAMGLRVPEKELTDAFARAPLEARREVSRHLAVVEGRGLALARAALADEDGHVRGNAAEAAAAMGLMELSPEVSAMTRQGFPDIRRKAMLALVRLDPPGAARLAEEFVTKGSAEDKKVYLAAAGRIDGEARVNLISLLLDDPEELIRKRAVAVLGDVMDQDGRFLGLLGRLLEGPSVPHEVLKVVREHRLVAFRDRLTEIFRDRGKEIWTRYYALCALGALGEKALIPVISEGLADENTLIKIGSIKALADLGDETAGPSVAPFTRSEDPTLRFVAEAALKALTSNGRRA